VSARALIPTGGSGDLLSAVEVAEIAGAIHEPGEVQVRQIDRLNRTFGAAWLRDVLSEARWVVTHPEEPQNRRRDGSARTFGGVFFRLARERLYAMHREHRIRWEAIGWFFATEDRPEPQIIPTPRPKGSAVTPPRPPRAVTTPPAPKPREGRLPAREGGARESYVSRPKGGTFGTGRGKRPLPKAEIIRLPPRSGPRPVRG